MWTLETREILYISGKQKVREIESTIISDLLVTTMAPSFRSSLKRSMYKPPVLTGFS